jgi:hypothetical protein
MKQNVCIDGEYCINAEYYIDVSGDGDGFNNRSQLGSSSLIHNCCLPMQQRKPAGYQHMDATLKGIQDYVKLITHFIWPDVSWGYLVVAVDTEYELEFQDSLG